MSASHPDAEWFRARRLCLAAEPHRDGRPLPCDRHVDEARRQLAEPDGPTVAELVGRDG